MPVIPETPWTANSTVDYADQNYQDGDRPSGALAAPQNLTAISGDTLLNIVWSSVVGATGYEVRIDGGAWQSTANLTYQFTSLTNDVLYLVECRATDSVIFSEISSTTGTPAIPGDWQLPLSNYQPTLTTAELIHPRPDSETPVWAKHRRHPIGLKYEIPIGVANGSWPFYFEPVTVPSGATIGQQLSVSGDTLVPSVDYGVVSWTTPTAGSHTFSFLVKFQDGTPDVSVIWTLEVTDTGIIYVDAVGGNDTTGDGSFSLPLKTMDGWFKEDHTDRTFSEYQVCYRAGTYDVYTADPATTGNLQLNYWNKPLVHFAYPSEVAIWDFDLGNFTAAQTTSGIELNGETHFDDWFLGGVECIGGGQQDGARRWNVNGDAKGNFPYDGVGGGCRNTWFRSNQKDWAYTGDPANNGGIVFGGNAGDVTKTRSHWYVTQCDISNITCTQTNTNFNGWFIGNVSRFLAEHVVVINTQFGRGPFSGKSSEYKTCYRNIDLSAAPDQTFNYDNAGSYAPLIGGGVEVSYCKVNCQIGRTAIISGHHSDIYGAGNPNHLVDYHFRNTISKAPSTTDMAFRAFFDWPVNVYDDIWVSEGDGVNLGPPLNAQVDGGWLVYNISSNPLDSSLNLVTDRLTYLGIKGSEVAT